MAPGADEIGLGWVSLSSLASAFFPGREESHSEAIEVPLPLSPEFWRTYRELLTGFLFEAFRFSNALTAAVQMPRTPREHEEEDVIRNRQWFD